VLELYLDKVKKTGKKPSYSHFCSRSLFFMFGCSRLVCLTWCTGFEKNIIFQSEEAKNVQENSEKLVNLHCSSFSNPICRRPLRLGWFPRRLGAG
jgi:hypothetical protein